MQTQISKIAAFAQNLNLDLSIDLNDRGRISTEMIVKEDAGASFYLANPQKMIDLQIKDSDDDFEITAPKL